MFFIVIYPDNLTAKPTLWLWELKDLAAKDLESLRTLRDEVTRELVRACAAAPVIPAVTEGPAACQYGWKY